MKKTALITGGTGFIGANLARRLLHEGHEVHLLARKDHASWRIEEIKRDVHIDEADLQDEKTLLQTIGKIKPDWVFHLAVYGAYHWQTDVLKMIQTNITGTVNLLHACLKAGFESFINTGTSSEYGYKDHAPGETDFLEPNSHYAVTKASSTLFCRHTAMSNKKHIPTLRLYSVYGPYEEPRRLMPTLILKGLEGKLPPMVNPEVARDYIYIDDVCNAYLFAAKKTGGELGAIYNVGTGVQTKIKDVVKLAKQKMEIRDEPIWGSMPGRVWDTDVWIADNAKIRSQLGWRPKFKFEKGFQHIVEWFKEHPELACGGH